MRKHFYLGNNLLQMSTQKALGQINKNPRVSCDGLFNVVTWLNHNPQLIKY